MYIPYQVVTAAVICLVLELLVFKQAGVLSSTKNWMIALSVATGGILLGYAAFYVSSGFGLFLDILLRGFARNTTRLQTPVDHVLDVLLYVFLPGGSALATGFAVNLMFMSLAGARPYTKWHLPALFLANSIFGIGLALKLRLLS